MGIQTISSANSDPLGVVYLGKPHTKLKSVLLFSSTIEAPNSPIQNIYMNIHKNSQLQVKFALSPHNST